MMAWASSEPPAIAAAFDWSRLQASSATPPIRSASCALGGVHIRGIRPQRKAVEASLCAMLETFATAGLSDMDLHLSGKVAIVTGASTGIGWATAQALAAEGVRVVGASRRPFTGEAALVSHFGIDLADAGSAERLVEHVMTLHKRLDILVNNAGVCQTSKGFLDEDSSRWFDTMNLNLHAAVRTMQAAIPKMVEGGVIINVTSVNSRMPATGGASYSASKAALLNLGKGVASEYASKGVRVVTVSPGLTATPMWLGPEGIGSQIATRTGGNADEVAAATAARMPMARFLLPDEIANCICFLASPRASAVTGSEVVVDGGLTPTL